LQEDAANVWNKESKEIKRMEKRVHRRKNREWMKVEMERLELLNSQNDTRKLYKALNNARKPFKPRVTLCKDEVGDIISDKQGILARWVRHFDKLLNGDPAAAVEKLKNNKVPGTDNLQAELIKYGGSGI
jgi:2'-5' RNA ligase